MCFCIFNFLYYSHYDYPYYLASIPAGLLFYLMGYNLKEIQYNKVIVFLSFTIYFFAGLCGWIIVDMHWNLSNSGSYYLWIPTSLAGIIVLCVVCLLIEKIRIFLFMPLTDLFNKYTTCNAKFS